MSDIEEDVEEFVDHMVHPDHELDKEAKERQPWMPIVGSIAAGLFLLLICLFFLK